jgi:hypothetical protein
MEEADAWLELLMQVCMCHMHPVGAFYQTSDVRQYKVFQWWESLLLCAQVLDGGGMEEADAWLVLRGILAGLAHIHSQVGYVEAELVSCCDFKLESVACNMKPDKVSIDVVQVCYAPRPAGRIWQRLALGNLTALVCDNIGCTSTCLINSLLIHMRNNVCVPASGISVFGALQCVACAATCAPSIGNSVPESHTDALTPLCVYLPCLSRVLPPGRHPQGLEARQHLLRQQRRSQAG